MVAGKVALGCKLVRLSSSSSRLAVLLTDARHSVVCRGESEQKARTANQLVPTSPDAKKRSTKQQIRQRVKRVLLIGQIEQEQ